MLSFRRFIIIIMVLASTLYFVKLIYYRWTHTHTHTHMHDNIHRARHNWSLCAFAMCESLPKSHARASWGRRPAPTDHFTLHQAGTLWPHTIGRHTTKQLTASSLADSQLQKNCYLAMYTIVCWPVLSLCSPTTNNN